MKILLFLAAATLTELPKTNSVLVGYDCSDPEVIAVVPLQDTLSCNTIPRDAVRSIRAEIYEIKSPKTIVGYRCQVRFKQTLVDWRGTRRALPSGDVIIGRNACLNAHMSGNLDLELRIPHLDLNGTTKHSIRTIYPDVRINQSHFVPGYHDQYYERDYEVALSQHSGLVNFEQNIVHFDNGIYCDFRNFSCVVDHIGELTWTSDLQQNLSTSIFGGDITLVTTNETLTTPTETFAVMQVMYDLLSFKVFDNVTFNGKTVFRTKHPDLYIEPITNSTLAWSHYKASKLNEYVNLTNSYSSRYDSEVPPGQPINHLEIAKRFCLKDSLHLRSNCNNSSDVLEVVIGCTFPLPRLGRIARVKRLISKAEIKQCAEKSFYIRQTDECYHAIPVRDDKYRDKFLNPFSRILIDGAEPTVCGTKLKIKGYESIKNSTYLEIPSESDKKTRFLPDWLLLIAIVSLCVWGLLGIIQLILLIVSSVKKRQYPVSANTESIFGCASMKSYVPSFVKTCTTRTQRVNVREEAELSVNQFTS